MGYVVYHFPQPYPVCPLRSCDLCQDLLDVVSKGTVCGFSPCAQSVHLQGFKSNTISCAIFVGVLQMLHGFMCQQNQLLTNDSGKTAF